MLHYSPEPVMASVSNEIIGLRERFVLYFSEKSLLGILLEPGFQSMWTWRVRPACLFVFLKKLVLLFAYPLYRLGFIAALVFVLDTKPGVRSETVEWWDVLGEGLT